MARARARRSRARRANPRGLIRYRGRWISAKPRRRRRNPLWRSRRSGKYRGRAPGRRLHRIRGGVGWHADNPPKRRRRGSRRRRNPIIRSHRRKGTRVRRYFRRANNPVRRRRYSRRRNNPVRYFGGRSRRSTRLMDNPVKAVMDIVKDAFSKPSLETMLHTGLGFGGSLAIAKFVSSPKVLNATGEAILDKAGRVGITLASTVITSVLGGAVVGKVGAARMVIGGLVATLWQAVTEVVKGTQAADFVPTLGQAVDEDFRKAVETEVLRNLRRGGGMNAYLTPAGSERYLTPAGSAAYFTPRGAGMEAFATERSIVDAGVGADAEFGRNSEIEQF